MYAPLAIANSGLVTSVGLSAPATCAAIRSALTNHTETRFMDSGGEWILAAQVPLPEPLSGRVRLVTMLAMAVEECLEPVAPVGEAEIPLLLCVAENERPGRLSGLDEHLLTEVESRLSIVFHPELSATIPYGRVGAFVALSRARALMGENDVPRVLIAAADSLLVGQTLSAFEAADRLLTSRNSNGFVPGEGAGAILVERAETSAPELVCTGLGFSQERATVVADEPLRGDGLTSAIKLALAESGNEMHDLDFRITDNAGEQYYFKEATLALSRTLRKQKPEFDIWHPADCVGEVGAVAGVTAIAVALSACQKSYVLGPGILVHASNDDGRRAAAILRQRGEA